MTVSREEVLWCYRMIFGREPESEAVIASHMHIRSVDILRRNFLKSREFALKNLLTPAPPPFPLPLPPCEIETAATAKQIKQCIAKTKATWSQLGAVKPHFSVLTDAQFLPENLAGNLETFWQSGEGECERIDRTLEKYSGASAREMKAVEYGCGVGRVTMALARRFAHVDAYDVSGEHLGLAQQRASELGITNVAFHQCAPDIRKLEPCDFLYSRIVFQHNPPPIIAHLIRMSLRALRPQGIAMFQVPVYRAGYRFVFSEWLAQPPASDMEMHCFPQGKVFEIVAEEDCIALEVRDDGSSGLAYLSNSFTVRRPQKRSRIFRPLSK
jgi:SAM-dependent methyltransferase